MRKLPCFFLVLVSASGCRYALPNSNCEWPGEARPGSLSEEAEFAEDLAIRYADADRSQWAARRAQCMVKLFQTVGDGHGVTPEHVWRIAKARPAGDRGG